MSRSSFAVRQVVMGQSDDIAVMEMPTSAIKSDVKVFSYKCRCLVPQDSAFSEREVLPPTNLHEAPFVTLFPDHITSHQVRSAFAHYGATLNTSLECDYFLTAERFVQSGRGATVIDPITLAQLDPGVNVVERPFKPEITYEIAVLRADNRARSMLADEFYKRLTNRLSEIEGQG